MKLYNPFKPHIVEFDDGTFAVRKFTWTGWGHLDNDICTEYWWFSVTINTARQFKCKTLAEARVLLITPKRAYIDPLKSKRVE